jgi:cyclohexyl-isocyanide hydratase
METVTSSSGLLLVPTVTYDACPQLDVLCIPGGAGVKALLRDAVTLEFVRQQATGAGYVTSVCTGALVLGAAGLLRGRRATTHWASHDLLTAFGAVPVKARVVRDGNLLTGGGIDFALSLAAELVGRPAAELIQLVFEYAPAPPFDAGSPETAPPAVLAAAQRRLAALQAERETLVAAITGSTPGG